MRLYHTQTREDASALDDMRNNMEIPVLSSELNSDPGIITAGVIESKDDNINPNHYKFGDMEARHFLDKVFKYGEFEAWQAPYISNAIEYIVRAPRKNGLEDFKKS